MKFLVFEDFCYIAIRKNASQFFTNYFEKELGWKEVTIHDIDWGHTKVFSHISDPLKRHIKGIAQAIDNDEIIRGIFNHPTYRSIFGHSILDEHCVPLYLTLGKNVEKIDWILLDSIIPSEILTNKFLSKYNIKNSITKLPSYATIRNSGENRTRATRSIIESLIDQHSQRDMLNLVYEQDKQLYYKVNFHFKNFVESSITKFNLPIQDIINNTDIWNSIHWDEISWLQNE